MASESLVSVLICTYNASSYIENTLDSVVNQTYGNLEILILDNDSNDNTVSKVKRYMDHDSRIQLFELDENLRNYPGHNYLLDQASGDYIAIQDHDDIWHEKKVEMQVELLDNNPEYVGCGGGTIKLWEGTNDIYEISFEEVSNFSPHPSLMFRNDGYRYDTSLNYKTDTYFMSNVLCSNGRKLYNFQKPLYISLVLDDGSNMTKTQTPLRDIFYYSIRARSPKTLAGQLLHYFSPNRTYPRNNIDRLEKEAEFDSVGKLKKSEFTRTYLDYIEDYIDSPSETAWPSEHEEPQCHRSI